MWMKKIRALRSLLRELRENKTIDVSAYRKLYAKAKGGEYRSRAHLKSHIEQTKGKGV
jgi:large subunit ribosomal protein L19e